MATAIISQGSNRQYSRVDDGQRTVIKVVGTSAEENRAFITIARHFKEKGINVPEIYEVSDDLMTYTQEDLGDDLLFNLVSKGRESGEYDSHEVDMLCKTIAELPKIQFIGSQDLDFSVCYPDREFNGRMIDFDLNYFKYCFLKQSGVEFNEIKLQDDFDSLKQDLLEDIGNTFMYRDFQARNVIMKDGEPYFIDFQGGRRGPIYYDVASFVWQARSRFPKELKGKLIETYLNALNHYESISEKLFYEKLRLFVLFRTLQVLGAYGFRGYFERKRHFIESIPFALDNLRELLETPLPDYPYLSKVLQALCDKKAEKEHSVKGDGTLCVDITSFSYRKGIPEAKFDNGGGYVFDCRASHNPGKYEQYAQMTGLDRDVIDFIEKDGELPHFLESVFNIMDRHVERFIQRGFSSLQVCFGCTGGRHRSVYSAEKLAEHLRLKYNIRIDIHHRELGIDREA